MKMEQTITREQKAKAYAMYIGQPIWHVRLGKATLRGVDMVGECYIHTLKNMAPDEDGGRYATTCPFSAINLMLKKLSAISDEDAIELATLQHKNITLPYAGVKLPEDRTRDEYLEHGKHIAQCFADARYLNGGVMFHQYLISKGYSVPLLCLNNQDPITAGLAIDATQS